MTSSLTRFGDGGKDLLPASQTRRPEVPALVARAGDAAVFAAEEFFYGAIRNEHTRKAYRRAVDGFLKWCEERGLELVRIAPGDVGRYFDALRGRKLTVATRKQHLAALRHFFDGMVRRHVMILNPALSVREERYVAVEGQTPQISIANARTLLASIVIVGKRKRADGSEEEEPRVVGLRDRAVLGILAYTACRAGAAAKLRCGDYYDSGDGQWVLGMREKGGKARIIPARGDLQQMIGAYVRAAGLEGAAKQEPLFRCAIGNTGRLAATGLDVDDVWRMMKRRLKQAKLPCELSPHSFRVAVITDLLEQGVPPRDVQYFVGHADPRTTQLYDRRAQKVTRNLVERISI